MIYIASTTDNDMAIPLSVEYTSILENNPDSSFSFFIMNDHLNQSSKNLLKAMEKLFPNCKLIKFLSPKAGEFKDANVSSPDSAIKRNTYYRFDVPSQLNTKRVLFLDADIICNGKLNDLFNADLDGDDIGAVEDQGYVTRLKEMGINDKPGNYFNAGVLLIDIKRWDKDHLTKKVTKLANDKPDMLKYQDQDALNAILDGRWKHLNPKFNVQSHLVKHEDGENPIRDRRKAEADALKKPVLIHYTNFDKPWISKEGHLHPLRQYYFKYKDQLILKMGNYIK